MRPLHVVSHLGFVSVSLVVVIAGLLKLSDLTSFGRSLDAWVIIPHWIVPMIAVLVPAAEIAIGAFALAAPGRPAAKLSVMGLVFAFTAMMILERSVGGQAACSCFGPISRGEQESLAFLLVRNGVMIALAAVSLLTQKEGRRPERLVDDEADQSVHTA